jgi:hypothetical protein
MAALSRRGLRGVSISELVAARAAGSARGLVGLTFDDGYIDVVENVIPVLQRFGFDRDVLRAGRRGPGGTAYGGRGQPGEAGRDRREAGDRILLRRRLDGRRGALSGRRGGLRPRHRTAIRHFDLRKRTHHAKTQSAFCHKFSQPSCVTLPRESHNYRESG